MSGDKLLEETTSSARFKTQTRKQTRPWRGGYLLYKSYQNQMTCFTLKARSISLYHDRTSVEGADLNAKK